MEVFGYNELQQLQHPVLWNDTFSIKNTCDTCHTVHGNCKWNTTEVVQGRSIWNQIIYIAQIQSGVNAGLEWLSFESQQNKMQDRVRPQNNTQIPNGLNKAGFHCFRIQRSFMRGSLCYLFFQILCDLTSFSQLSQPSKNSSVWEQSWFNSFGVNVSLKPETPVQSTWPWDARHLKI